MEYNKPFKQGRSLQSGRGPRDLQRARFAPQKTATDDTFMLIKELRAQITLLREELNSRPAQEGYSTEEFNRELVKASEQIMHDIENKFKTELSILKQQINKYKEEATESNVTITEYRLKIKELKGIIDKLKNDVRGYNSEVAMLRTKLESANEIIKVKDDTILTLKSTTGAVAVVSTPIDSARPQMEEAFVDPLEKDAKDGLESHIEVKEDIQEDEEVSHKIGKLKELLGSLPIGG